MDRIITQPELVYRIFWHLDYMSIIFFRNAHSAIAKSALLDELVYVKAIKSMKLKYLYEFGGNLSDGFTGSSFTDPTFVRSIRQFNEKFEWTTTEYTDGRFTFTMYEQPDVLLFSINVPELRGRFFTFVELDKPVVVAADRTLPATKEHVVIMNGRVHWP